MREDMDKVIVERPRMGSRRPSRKKGYRKYVERTRVEDLPRREPMLGRWKGRERFLNEHLGPMRRFLRSNIGRPWNKVHQELCEHVSFDNAVQAHVLSHVFDYVHRHVTIVEHRVIARRQWGYSTELRAREMYVCPATGLLRVVAPAKRRRTPKKWVRGTRLHCLWRNNVWWEVRLQVVPDNPEGLWDVWLERDVCKISASEIITTYGSKLFAISKRPLNRKETKSLHREIRRSRRGS